MTAERKRIGIVGAGQLARMGWQAAISLDLGLLCLGAAGEAAAGAGAPLMEGTGRDPVALAELASRCQVLTFEHELVDLASLSALEAGGVRVRPSAEVLALAVDKLHQRATLSAMDGVLVPDVRSGHRARRDRGVSRQHGWPVVIKARSGGYDGRGVWMCADSPAAARALEDGRAAGLELYVEGAVEIELSSRCWWRARPPARSPCTRRSRPARSTGCAGRW